MAKLSHANSRRMYSWWWDGHTSPKNSRWLHENLTDMDAKVNSMIKLIEQDADSFAKRAEMYYEKRPELMKMVEEFYRAYRALAERYDHATGALRQAHQTMTEAFPGQEPSGQNEDELASYANENNPQTPFDDSFGHGDDRNFGVQRARSGLSFNKAEENDQNPPSVGKLEKEKQTLREALAKFEAKKESSLAYYEQSLEKLSHQELEFSNVQEEQANKAENEVESLRKALKELEVEKEKSLVQYQKCLERIEKKEGIISNAQKDVSDLNEQACKAETEAQTLNLALATMECEKATSLRHCKQSLEKILNLENKLVIADGEAKKLNNRAEEAEAEVETLKQALTVLGVDKDDTAVQYQECLDTISSLEQKVSCLQEEVQVLTWEVKSGVAKLKGAEEQSLHLEGSIQSLHSEMETLKLELGVQRDELTEKKREMGKLWTSIQEEQLRFVEAETSFQAWQHSHHQTEEQLKSLALELQNMQSEISSLRKAKEKLEEEVELRVDRRNVLQQEFCLKEELNDVKNNYHAMLDQVEAVGFNSECFQSSVKDLQDENLNLKETREKEIREKIDLLKKLENLEKFAWKNALLEKSLLDLSADLEGSKEEIIAMEKSFQSLSEEKSTHDSEKASFATQLRVATKNLEKLSEKNTILENAVSDAHNEIEGLKIRLSSIEDSRQLLQNKKSDLINEKVTSVSQVEITRQKIDDIEKKNRELEKKHLVLEKERDSTLSEVEEVRLIVKEGKLKEAKQITEIANLHGKVVDMQNISVTLQEENLKLINEKTSLVKDFLDLQEKNDTLEGENISNLGETATLSNLSLIFKNIINEANRYQKIEIDLWESEATKLSSDLHTSSVSRALLEKKFHELTEAVKSLEEEANSKDTVIQLLKERITTLEAENDDIGTQLAAYVPAISSLKDCISSLENSTCFSTQHRDNNDEIVKAAIENHVESHEELSVDQKDMDILSELRQLEASVKAVTRKIEELGSKGILNQDNIKPLSVNLEFQNGLLTKDMTLDQISEGPSYGIGRKECISANSQSIGFNSNITTPTKDGVDFESGVIVEKELGVDKLTIANRMLNQELDKPKILESLNSDSQKLNNLQTIVWDLKRKTEMSEKTRDDKSFGECENIEQQLEKAEEDIMQLSDLTKILMKSVDESNDVKEVVESEEKRNLRRKFSEQARKVSERIGQLQLEVQEIQSIMLKLEDENGKEKNKRKLETSATKRRTSLRNYLGLRTNNREKKRAFCGFVQPPTNED